MQISLCTLLHSCNIGEGAEPVCIELGSLSVVKCTHAGSPSLLCSRACSFLCIDICVTRVLTYLALFAHAQAASPSFGLSPGTELGLKVSRL